ncbi:MAG: hypothetical protein NVSMB33_12680 [Ktedonobacteraceae bacterium]
MGTVVDRTVADMVTVENRVVEIEGRVAEYTVTVVSYNLAVHIGLDMAVEIAGMVDMARIVCSYSGPSVLLNLRPMGYRSRDRNAHLEHSVVHNWCRSWEEERLNRWWEKRQQIARVFRTADKTFYR